MYICSETGQSTEEKLDETVKEDEPVSDVRTFSQCCLLLSCTPFSQAVAEDPISSVSQQDLSDVASTGREGGDMSEGDHTD